MCVQVSVFVCVCVCGDSQTLQGQNNSPFIFVINMFASLKCIALKVKLNCVCTE